MQSQLSFARLEMRRLRLVFGTRREAGDGAVSGLPLSFRKPYGRLVGNEAQQVALTRYEGQ